MCDDARAVDGLFVYGTLADPATFRAVTGVAYTEFAETQPPSSGLHACPAELRDYDAPRLDGRFRYAVARPGATLPGRLIRPVHSDLFRRIDAYEGDGYRRVVVTVTTARESMPAYLYVAANRGKQSGPKTASSA